MQTTKVIKLRLNNLLFKVYYFNSNVIEILKHLINIKIKRLLNSANYISIAMIIRILLINKVYFKYLIILCFNIPYAKTAAKLLYYNILNRGNAKPK
jgi:hypothetical protein